MGNPYAPLSRPPVRDSPEPFIRRLRILGATDDEIEAVRHAWVTGSYTPSEKRHVQAMSDVALRRSLIGIRKEHYEGTHTEEEEAADRLELALAQARLFPRNVTLEDIESWVGEDEFRRQAIEQLRAEFDAQPPDDLPPDDLPLSLEQ